jgi:hypothetical protein
MTWKEEGSETPATLCEDKQSSHDYHLLLFPQVMGMVTPDI